MKLFDFVTKPVSVYAIQKAIPHKVQKIIIEKSKFRNSVN